MTVCPLRTASSLISSQFHCPRLSLDHELTYTGGLAGKSISSAQSCLILCDPMAHQAPLSMGFSRQDCWSGLPFPPPRDLPDPRIEPTSPVSPVMAGRFFTTEPPGKPKSILKWKWKQLSCVQLLATPWTIQSMVVLQARILEWQPFLSPGDLSNPGIEPGSPTLQVDSLPAEHPGKPQVYPSIRTQPLDSGNHLFRGLPKSCFPPTLSSHWTTCPSKPGWLPSTLKDKARPIKK